MQGLYKIHGAIQTNEAWKDWYTMAEKAYQAGRPDLILSNKPAYNAGWRRIDKCIANIRKGLETDIPFKESEPSVTVKLLES